MSVRLLVVFGQFRFAFGSDQLFSKIAPEVLITKAGSLLEKFSLLNLIPVSLPFNR